MPVNFTSPTPNARPLPRPPIQPRKKPKKLPHRVQSEAARHHGIVLEMTFEEPQIRFDIADRLAPHLFQTIRQHRRYA